MDVGTEELAANVEMYGRIVGAFSQLAREVDEIVWWLQDAGDTCPFCGNVITWVEHLPGRPVRCFA